MNNDELLQLVTLAITEGEDAGSHAYRVTAHGEIDVASAPQLAGALDELIDQGALIIVLDAGDVHFLDSSGLRAVIAAGNRLAENGGRLLIEGMSGAVQRVLEVSGLIDRYRR